MERVLVYQSGKPFRNRSGMYFSQHSQFSLYLALLHGV